MIRKAYMYGTEAGVEIITSWDDFANYHIQDDSAAISVAEEILRHGESRNEAEGEQIYEVYTSTDDDLLREAVEHAKLGGNFGKDR